MQLRLSGLHWMGETSTSAIYLQVGAGVNCLRSALPSQQDMKRQMSPDDAVEEASKRAAAQQAPVQLAADKFQPSAKEVAAAKAARARLYGSGGTVVRPQRQEATCSPRSTPVHYASLTYTTIATTPLRRGSFPHLTMWKGVGLDVVQLTVKMAALRSTSTKSAVSAFPSVQHESTPQA